jgi:hypothetical protein
LVSDGLKFADRRDPGFESTFDNLRRALEQDRFGIVANVLIVNNGCTADRCDALVVLRDPTRVKANIRDKAFDTLVARYSSNWQAVGVRNGAAVVSGAPSASFTTSSGLSSPAAAPAPAEPPAPPPAPVAAEPAPPASPPAVVATPAPPRRPAPPRPAQPRPAQAQPSPVQLPSPPPRAP